MSHWTDASLTPAVIDWQSGTLYSPAYGDVYHPVAGALGQARHVFMAGNGLPDRWAGHEDFTVLETGFGCGLNFLATWQAWRASPHACARLHYCAVEKHPFQLSDLRRIHALWPELAPMAGVLQSQWPLGLPGFHRLVFEDGRIQLTLMFGEAAACLPQLRARVDAFYLDGFAPERNPEMWDASLFAQCARLAVPGATAATYSVAGHVRRKLEAQGFACSKRSGYDGKRHCLCARFIDSAPAVDAPAIKRVAVVGGGVAGAAVARSLARRGVAVTVMEDARNYPMRASANPLAVFRPTLPANASPAGRLTLAAFLFNLADWHRLDPSDWQACGVLHLLSDPRQIQRQRDAMAGLPAEFARWVDADEAHTLAHYPVRHGGVHFPRAGWVKPTAVTRVWLSQPGIEWWAGEPVSTLARCESDWCLRAGERRVRADAVVLANAGDAGRFAPELAWPLQAVRGQLTSLPAGTLQALSCVVSGEGYVIPGDVAVTGASYDHDTLDLTLCARSQAENLARLAALLDLPPGRLENLPLGGRAALRAVLPDRLPLLGEVVGRPQLYVAAGYASRGVVWAGLLGEALADAILGQPRALTAELLTALDPGRFASRRKG